MKGLKNIPSLRGLTKAYEVLQRADKIHIFLAVNYLYTPNGAI